MSRTSRLLDLFCGAGGAAMGYYQAGFTDIVGVDLSPQPRYPFTFVQDDALAYVKKHGQEFDAIHASPPCQGYSIMRNLPWLREKDYPMLIVPTMALLDATRRPYVLENVMGAKLDANWLCGGMFDRPFFRHRYFASNWLWFAPAHPPHQHTVRNGRTLGSHSRDIVHSGGISALVSRNGAQKIACNVGHAAGVALAREAMEIDWMTREELTQAVPPVYTRYIGRQLLRYLGNARP